MKKNFIILVGSILAIVGINYLSKSTKLNATGKKKLNKKKKKPIISSGGGGGGGGTAETFNSNRLKNLFVLQRK